MNTREYDVVAAGHICLDMTPMFGEIKETSMADIFVPGRLINMREIRLSTGGPVSNTGIALHKLGVGVKLMGKIGDDALGDTMLRLLSAGDAQNGMTVAAGESTSYTVVIVPAGYDRIFLHNPGANDTFDSNDIDYDAVSRARLFHLGYPPLMRRMYENDGEELVNIFRRVKELGVTTSLDMSLPDENSDSGRADWDKILRRVLPYTDVYIPSAEETMFMIDRPVYRRLKDSAGERDMLESLDMNALRPLGEKLLAYGAGVAVIKCGVKGYYIATAGEGTIRKMGRAAPENIENWAGRELIEESFHVENVASATGSGDSSIAGFLAAYLRGMSIEDCIRTACCTGGQNVQVVDALSGIKTFGQTREMMKRWEKNRLRIEGDYFRFHGGKGVWVGRKDRLYE